jgi:hypothetical protein
MLLHEIYGKDLFKITKYEIDILRYRPKSVLLTAMAGGAGAGAGAGAGGGGYIEDGSSTATAEEYDDTRITMPQETTNEGGNILSTSIRWLFGTQ